MANKYKGKTFAQIADMLQKESADRPNDPVSKQTLDDMMSRLRDAQEEYNRLKEQRRLAKAIDSMSDEEKAAIMSSLVQPMTQQEGIDLGQPMYKSGGKIFIKPENRGKFTALKKRTGKSATWFKQHGTPAQKKMATFALNARKWKHEDGGHLFPEGGGLNPFDYATRRLTMPWERIDKLPSLYDQYEEQWINDAANELANMQVEQPAPKEQLMSNEAALAGLDAAIESTPSSSSFTFNPEYLRYAPVLGSAEAMLRAALQPKDFTVGNEYRQLSSQLKPIAAPHVGGYRRYNPYDINLGDIENIALTANALAANRGQNRATQGALNAAVINAAQKTAAARNLAAQQANEANRLAVDTYNLGIDQFNANRDTQYDQLNQQILQNKLNMLMSAAQADDASKEAWANMYNTTRENVFNQLGNVGRDEWNRNQFLKWIAAHPAAARQLGIELQ
jgi:hypothetical protein